MAKRRVTMLAICLAMAVVAIAPPAGAHPWGGYQKDECQGEAPALAVCSTGAHFRFSDEATFRHGFTGTIGAGFTGTVVSRLTYAGGERTFQCDFSDGGIVEGSCGGGGEFPPPQTYFVQVCQSYALGTTTPGGSGGWGCFMEHG